MNSWARSSDSPSVTANADEMKWNYIGIILGDTSHAFDVGNVEEQSLSSTVFFLSHVHVRNINNVPHSETSLS